MPPTHLHILQHALGADPHGRQPDYFRPDGRKEIPTYRNHFVTGRTSTDYVVCLSLVSQGFMVDHGPQRLAGGDHCFTVTRAGYDAMRAASPTTPKLSKAKRRWSCFRNLREACPDLTFTRYLRLPDRLEIEARHGV